MSVASSELHRAELDQMNKEVQAGTLDAFLSSVQGRAFSMAKAATGHHEDALDIVQDAMMQLVSRYQDRSPDEWRMLFYRILHNRINDNFRRRKVRDKFKGWLPSSPRHENDTAEVDGFQTVPGTDTDLPDVHVGREEKALQIHRAVNTLPRRQREAFMLRCWEGLSTAETATTMQCSEGSVKTHYSRALTALKGLLEEYRT